MQELAMLMILTRQSSCLMIDFKWCQVNLSGPGKDKSLHLLIACLNSSLEKGLQWEVDLHSILLRILELTWQLRAVLKVSRMKEVDLAFFHFLLLLLFSFWFIFLYSIFRTRVRVRVTRLCCHTAGHASHIMHGRT